MTTMKLVINWHYYDA